MPKMLDALGEFLAATSLILYCRAGRLRRVCLCRSAPLERIEGPDSLLVGCGGSCRRCSVLGVEGKGVAGAARLQVLGAAHLLVVTWLQMCARRRTRVLIGRACGLRRNPATDYVDNKSDPVGFRQRIGLIG